MNFREAGFKQLETNSVKQYLKQNQTMQKAESSQEANKYKR